MNITKNNHWKLIVMTLSFMIGMNLFGSTSPQLKQTNEPIPKELWQAFSEAQHKVEAVSSKKENYTYRAYNPRMKYSIRYGEKGLELRAADWKFEMSLEAYGQTGLLSPVKKAQLKTKVNRVSFERGNISEWYVNNPKGLEQGFTLKQPKDFDKSKPVILSLKYNSSLSPKSESGAKSISFYKDKKHAFDYEKLSVIDAKGKSIPAHLALKGKHIEIVIDAKEAVWPVMVDPVFTAKLEASDGASGDFFGYSVAISDQVIVVGAPEDDDPDGSGSAYIFEYVDGSWIEKQKLTAYDSVSFAGYGSSVAIEGDTVLVGSQEGNSGSMQRGAVYIYVRSGNNWIFKQKLANEEAFDFGKSVAIDGSTIVVGAYDTSFNAYQNGTAYVFVPDENNTWVQQQRLVASDPVDKAYFGYDVDIDGNTVIIGATGANSNDVNGTGAAYIFTRNDTEWSQQVKLTAYNGTKDDRFGGAVAIERDTAVISAFYDKRNRSTNVGTAYIYMNSGSGWVMTNEFYNDIDEWYLAHWFGFAIDISNNTLMISDDGGSRVFIYHRSGDTWNYSNNIEGTDYIEFGRSVALDNGIMVIGSIQDENDNGAAYCQEYESPITYNFGAKLIPILVVLGLI